MRSLAVFVLAIALATGSYAQIEAQINKTAECVRTIFNEGRPNIGMPSFNPLFIEKTTWNLKSLGLFGVSGTITLENFTVANLFNYYISFIEFEETSNGYRVGGVSEWPHPAFEGNYKLDVKFYGNTLAGSGKISSEFINYVQDVRQTISNSGLISGVETVVKIQDIKFHIDEVLINGRDIAAGINEKANQAAGWINQNSNIVGGALSNIFMIMSNGNFNPFPRWTEEIVKVCY